MYLEMFLRIFSDCCIFFALLGCCPSVLPYSYPLIAAALICGIAAGLAAFLRNREKYVIAYFCAALPFLSLLMADGWREMLILALPILYTAGIILTDKMYLEYFGYRQYLKRATVFLLIVWAVISLAVFLEDPRGLEEKVVFTDGILQYTGIFFLIGVILQRKLRMGTGRSHGELGQIIAMVGSVGVICGGFLLTEPVLMEKIHEYFKKIGPMILAPVMIAAEYIQTVMNKITEWMKKTGYDKDKYRQEVLDEGSPSLPVGFPDGTEDIPPEAAEPGHTPWILIIAVVAALIAVGLMVYFYAKWKEKQESSVAVSFVAEGKKSKQKEYHSNRKKVRQMYREFLRLEQKRGTVIKPRHTTEDILSCISGQTDRDAAETLREVYISARYDESRDVNRLQVDTARQAMKQIRKEVSER